MHKNLLTKKIFTAKILTNTLIEKTFLSTPCSAIITGKEFNFIEVDIVFSGNKSNMVKVF